ncbi:unnamed protein product [Rotaria sp. Silwood1]|nr:unnamed protein product [Rotaria sp. Silwood1]
MDLQPIRQFDYLQRTLSIFLTNPSNMSEQFESLIDELIKENKQINKSPKSSPESSSSDSKSDLLTTSNSPQPLPKKRSAPLTTNSKPPPSKRLKSSIIKDDDDDDDNDECPKKKKQQLENLIHKNDKDDDIYQDDDDNDDIKLKSSESQINPILSSSTRDIDEFAIELGLVCNKCMVLTEEKDNRLVECHECHAKYHQKCHKPPVSTTDISDPRCLWYCAKCRKLINKRQQSQSSIKETKTNSNSSSSINKAKIIESPSTTGKKTVSTSMADVTTGLFSFKSKPSDSTISDTTTISNPSISSSNSSLTNGITTKNTNGWASLATGFKEKKITSEVTSTTSNNSASSILAELTALTTSSNSNSNTKRSPPSPKSINSTSLKPTINGNNINSLKTTSSLSLSSLKSNKPSSPPVLKSQISSSSLKSTQKLIPTSKNLQRISSPTPLGRQTSINKSPPSTSSTTYNRLNSSSSNSPSSSSTTTTTTGTNTKIATGLDFEKRLKQMKKMAAEKNEPYNFECSQCGDVYSTAWYLIQHYQRMHVSLSKNQIHVSIATIFLQDEQWHQLELFIKHFSLYVSLSNNLNVTSSTTHLLVDDSSHPFQCNFSKKIFQAVARHIFIVSIRWIEECLLQNEIIDETPYKIHGDETMKTMHLTCYTSINTLFSSSILFAIDCTSFQRVLTRNDLIELVILSNAKLFDPEQQKSIEIQSKLLLVLVDPRVDRYQLEIKYKQWYKNVKFLTPGFLLKSIIYQKQQPFEDFEL